MIIEISGSVECAPNLTPFCHPKKVLNLPTFSLNYVSPVNRMLSEFLQFTLKFTLTLIAA